MTGGLIVTPFGPPYRLINMYWQEDEEQSKRVSDSIVDVVYGLDCRSLPVDHAFSLSEAILEHLPWLVDEQGAGIHPISIPEAGNGWLRPEGGDELLHLSKRTKLTLRIPSERFDEAAELCGKQLVVAGNNLTVLKMRERLLQPMETVFSRYNVLKDGMDEAAFMQDVMQTLQAMGIKPRKMLPGRAHSLRTDEGELQTLTLMIADLSQEDSLRIQQNGIGEHQHMGCGLFIPQKSITEVHEVHE